MVSAAEAGPLLVLRRQTLSHPRMKGSFWAELSRWHILSPMNTYCHIPGNFPNVDSVSSTPWSQNPLLVGSWRPRTAGHGTTEPGWLLSCSCLLDLCLVFQLFSLWLMVVVSYCRQSSCVTEDTSAWSRLFIPIFFPLLVSRAPLGLEGRHLLAPPTEVHLIDYVQIAIHLHATIKLLIVRVGVTHTECICIVPELTSKQKHKAKD